VPIALSDLMLEGNKLECRELTQASRGPMRPYPASSLVILIAYISLADENQRILCR